jgi:hypothetical protein
MVTSLVLGMTGLWVLYLLRYPTRRTVNRPSVKPQAEYDFGEPLPSELEEVASR